jgi:hypothetical protein
MQMKHEDRKTGWVQFARQEGTKETRMDMILLCLLLLRCVLDRRYRVGVPNAASWYSTCVRACFW